MGKKNLEIQVIQELSGKAQKALARKLFDYETIIQKITEEATKGKEHVRILQELAVSLNETPAAQELCKRLEKGGFSITWVDAGRRIELVKNGSYELVAYQELVIMWGAGYQGGITVDDAED